MANPMPKRKVRYFNKVRRNIRISVDLDNWIVSYAKSRNISVTRIIVDFLHDLRKKTEDGHVEQF